MTDTNFDKLILKIFMGLSEVALVLFYGVASFVAGIFLFLIRKYIYRFLNCE